MKEEVIELFEDYGFNSENIKWTFEYTDKKYLDFESYRTDHNLTIRWTSEEDIGGNEERAKTYYALATELKDRGYYFYLSVDVFDISKLLVFVTGDLISEEQWLKRIMS